MTSLRLSLRSKLLTWLGYGFAERPLAFRPGYSASGTTDALLFDLDEAARRSIPCSMASQFGLRRVPEVPPGVVRIVVEVSE